MTPGEPPKIAAEAVVHPSAVLKNGVVVHSFAFVGAGAVLEEGAEVGPGAVVLDGVTVGRGARISGEAVLGSTGFGYIFDGARHCRVPQVGTVKVGAESLIGPATCVDRATLDTTVIGDGVKIGALCQIAHNCAIGDGSTLGPTCGLAGSTRLGRNTKFGVGIGTAGHSQYGDDVSAEDLSGFTRRSVPGRTHWSGYPARRSAGSSVQNAQE